ncbi:hypothetical protein QTN25_003039 [Entamoeba marina]
MSVTLQNVFQLLFNTKFSEINVFDKYNLSILHSIEQLDFVGESFIGNELLNLINKLIETQQKIEEKLDLTLSFTNECNAQENELEVVCQQCENLMHKTVHILIMYYHLFQMILITFFKHLRLICYVIRKQFKNKLSIQYSSSIATFLDKVAYTLFSEMIQNTTIQQRMIIYNELIQLPTCGNWCHSLFSFTYSNDEEMFVIEITQLILQTKIQSYLWSIDEGNTYFLTENDYFALISSIPFDAFFQHASLQILLQLFHLFSISLNDYEQLKYIRDILCYWYCKTFTTITQRLKELYSFISYLPLPHSSILSIQLLGLIIDHNDPILFTTLNCFEKYLCESNTIANYFKTPDSYFLIEFIQKLCSFNQQQDISTIFSNDISLKLINYYHSLLLSQNQLDQQQGMYLIDFYKQSTTIFQIPQTIDESITNIQLIYIIINSIEFHLQQAHWYTDLSYLIDWGIKTIPTIPLPFERKQYFSIIIPPSFYSTTVLNNSQFNISTIQFFKKTFINR